MARAHTGERVNDLVRLLNLIPYFQAHPDTTIAEAAADLGRSPGEIAADLRRLWCCGTPGLMPDNLVDFETDFKSVTITNSQGMDKALNLTTSEAGTLLLALEALESRGSVADVDSITSAAEKLRIALGAAGAPVMDVEQSLSAAERDFLATVRHAVAVDKQLRFSYSGALDAEPQLRTISPVAIFDHDGHSYVRGWDHDRAAERTFRADRAHSASVLDLAREVPSIVTLDADDPFDLTSSGEDVRIQLKEEALWVAEYYPVQLQLEPIDGWYPATVRMLHPHWLYCFVASLGENVRISSPAVVQEASLVRARAALDAYDQFINDHTSPTATER
ncbi:MULTISPECIES: YafY family protein [Corynebacterium]|uniref:helix-turn-helix transcriptional regulator n=1 Tax=Corynebacterium TaxID=1716 RepID=UPI00124CF27E|nr:MULTISPECIES: WYL domain-containing protein [Corynebacterium]